MWGPPQLAYLDVEIKTPKKLTGIVKLKEFVIPNTELIPEDEILNPGDVIKLVAVISGGSRV